MPEIQVGPPYARRTVEAEVINEILAVYRVPSGHGTIRRYQPMYNVEHLPSGASISSYVLHHSPSRNRYEALALANAMQDIDFGVGDEIRHSYSLVQRVRAAAQEIVEVVDWRGIARSMAIQEGEEYECSHCHVTHPGLPDVEDTSPFKLCEGCAQEYISCERCGILEDEDDSHTVEHSAWCDVCYHDYAFTCEGCMDSFHIDESRSLHGDMYCGDCFYDRAFHCDHCDDPEDSDEMRDVDGGSWCSYCAEAYAVHCDRCEELTSASRTRSTYDEDGDEVCVCRDCYQDLQRRDIRSASSIRHEVLSGSVRETDFITYGVEVETEFDRGCPFQVGGYHSGHRAGPEFFSGWHAEADGSLNRGGEFITPDGGVSGAHGLAQIMATFKILKEAGGRMPSNCGQHTTVQTGGGRQQVETQYLALALEEALLATTGSMRRIHYGYCPRLKGSTRTVAQVKAKQISGGGSVASPKYGSLIEFRYPPGTLVGAQVAINVGLCRMIVMLAQNPDADEGIVDESLELESSHGPSHEKIHGQILLGLRFIAKQGWTPTGEMKGLPYDPDDAPKIRLVDERRGHDVKVPLPPKHRIIERLERQITRFYKKFASQHGLDEEKRDELTLEALYALQI